MLFMLRISVEMMALVVLNWELWIGLLVLGVGASIARRRAGTREQPSGSRRRYGRLLGASSVVAVPLLMLMWGLFFWPERGRSAHEQLALRGLDALLLCQLALCFALVWRGGGRPRTAFGAALALWWAAAARATAGMAVTNTWL